MSDVVHGDGYSVGRLVDLGDGPGFRKLRDAYRPPGEAS